MKGVYWPVGTRALSASTVTVLVIFALYVVQQLGARRGGSQDIRLCVVWNDSHVAARRRASAQLDFSSPLVSPPF